MRHAEAARTLTAFCVGDIPRHSFASVVSKNWPFPVPCKSAGYSIESFFDRMKLCKDMGTP